MKLTPDQLLDIIFQKDNRITKGILDHRNPLQKLSDQILTYRDTDMSIHYGSMKERIKGLCFVFNQTVGNIVEHPRSLRKAKMELKALGFSKEQIKGISRLVSGFNYSDYNRLHSKDEGEALVADDRAFLGLAVLPHSGERQVGYSKEFDLNPLAANTAYSVSVEDELYDQAKLYLDEDYMKQYGTGLSPAGQKVKSFQIS